MSEWKTTKLKEFVTLKRGYDLPHNKSREGDYPVITSTNIRGYHDEYKVDSPVVTVGRSGSIGKVQIVNKKAWPLKTMIEFIRLLKDLWLTMEGKLMGIQYQILKLKKIL